ncbi:MAG: MFS transporter [Acidimicrobiia bacterium]|nr:MFS transporter [Acidimicrobiia bacterium]
MRLESTTEISTAQDSFRLAAYLQISALISLSVWMLLFLPDFLVRQGWSSQKVGWAVGSYFSIYLLMQILAGQLANRYGNITTALIGAGLGVAASISYMLALKWPNTIFAARMLHGSASALVTIGVVSHLADSVPVRLKGRVLGYFGVPGFVMLAAGPSLSEILRKASGVGGAFAAVFAIYLILISILRHLPESLQREDLPSEPLVHMLRENFRRLKSILAYSFGFGFCCSVWQSFLAPSLSHLGAGAVSIFGVGYGAGAIVSRLGISQRLEVGSRRLGAIASLSAYGACLALLPQSARIWQLGILALLIGLCHGVYYPALSSLATERFHQSGTGAAMSLYMSASSLGHFLGPPLWGLLADLTEFQWIFAAAGATLVVASLAFVANERRS